MTKGEVQKKGTPEVRKIRGKPREFEKVKNSLRNSVQHDPRQEKAAELEKPRKKGALLKGRRHLQERDGISDHCTSMGGVKRRTQKYQKKKLRKGGLFKGKGGRPGLVIQKKKPPPKKAYQGRHSCRGIRKKKNNVGLKKNSGRRRGSKEGSRRLNRRDNCKNISEAVRRLRSEDHFTQRKKHRGQKGVEGRRG